jgi:hypothetical protein
MDLEEAIKTLRKLNKPVPKPMHLPTSDEVSNTQQKLGVVFHPDYYKYLLEASDVVYGILEPCTITLVNSYRDLVTVAQEAWDSMGVSRNLIPICEDNGDYYCMNQSGEVVFWSHEGLTDEKWPNLAAWIEDVWLAEG